MAILVACECGREFLTDDCNAGREANCLDCRRVIAIPAGSDLFSEPAPRLETLVSPFNRRAVASLILGVLSFGFLFLAGVPAIGLGVGAVAEIRRSRGRSRGVWLAMIGMALGVVNSTALTFVEIRMATQTVHSIVHEKQCSDQLVAIYAAITRIQSIRRPELKQGSVPSAAIFDRQGRPLLSWRVAILPALGPEGEQLFEKFHLDEPWDSPHNYALIAEMPAIYRCVSMSNSPPGTTSYQFLVGPGTAFDGPKAVQWEDFNNGKTPSTLIVEADTPVPWTAPLDVLYDPKEILNMRGANHSGDYHVLSINGSITVHDWIPPEPTTDQSSGASKP